MCLYGTVEDVAWSWLVRSSNVRSTRRIGFTVVSREIVMEYYGKDHIIGCDCVMKRARCVRAAAPSPRVGKAYSRPPAARGRVGHADRSRCLDTLSRVGVASGVACRSRSDRTVSRRCRSSQSHLSILSRLPSRTSTRAQPQIHTV